MKLKNYICIILVLGLIVAIIIYCQKDKEIHSITIFKWSKTENADLQKLLVIDSAGTITIDRKQSKYKVNITTFNKSILEFIEKEKVEKIPGNEPWRLVKPPKKYEQKIYFSIIFLDDYHDGTKFYKPIYFSWKKTGLKINDSDYPIYRYLNGKDSIVLRKLLK